MDPRMGPCGHAVYAMHNCAAMGVAHRHGIGWVEWE